MVKLDQVASRATLQNTMSQRKGVPTCPVITCHSHAPTCSSIAHTRARTHPPVDNVASHRLGQLFKTSSPDPRTPLNIQQRLLSGPQPWHLVLPHQRECSIPSITAICSGTQPLCAHGLAFLRSCFPAPAAFKSNTPKVRVAHA